MTCRNRNAKYRDHVFTAVDAPLSDIRALELHAMKPTHLLSDLEFSQLAREAAALPDAPPALQRAAIDQWPSTSSLLQTAVAAVVNRVVALLTFDSWAAGSLAHGVRAVPSDNRHLLFSALGRDVDVRVTPAADHFVLAGQILGPDESGTVELANVAADGDNTNAEAIRSANLDALGQFRIDGIPGGAYVLRLRLGDDEIVLPPIDLGARRA